MLVGVDIAKNVMQVHFVNTNTGEIFKKALKRDKLLKFFINHPPCLIGMEASGGAHHWARQLTRLGYTVKLMPGEFVKGFNIRNKMTSLTHSLSGVRCSNRVKQLSLRPRLNRPCWHCTGYVRSYRNSG